jgi:hypothetical protein
MGSAVDSAFDFAGDVIGGAGDLVGDAVETVADNPELLALVAVPFMGPEMFALDAAAAEGLGGVGAFDVASSALPGLTFDAATGAYTLADAGLGGLGLYTPGGGELFTGIINADTFDPSSFLPGNNPYDPTKQFSDYAKYAKDAYNIYNMLNPDSQQQVQSQFANQGLYNPSSGEFDYASALSPFLNYGQQAYNRYSTLQPFANLDPANFDVMDVLGNISMKGLEELKTLPGAVGTGLGVLSIYDQMRVNNLIQKGYDENKAKQLAYQQKFTTPEGIASLPKQDITGLTPRTVSDVVVKPKAAKGGSINDLYKEYSELNNRMRNYRRLAKGGIV